MAVNFTSSAALVCRTSAGIDMVPTMTTCNYRIGLLLADGQMGLLRIEDAERVQVSLQPLELFPDAGG